MRLFTSLESVLQGTQKAVLAIGNFDGVHLGHQAIIRTVVDRARRQNAIATIITFQNHPLTVLEPKRNMPLLISSEHKMMLISALGVDVTIQLPFTEDFSQLSAEDFLQRIQHVLPLSDLILGHDARLGKDRLGDKESIIAWADAQGIRVEYMPAVQLAHGQTISSSYLRQLITQGLWHEAEACLGRPHSFYGTVMSGHNLGRRIGFPTLNLNVAGLCLPPLGVYTSKIKIQDTFYKGISNLGVAPTTRDDSIPLLETHLLNLRTAVDAPQPDSTIEVLLERFIRPEKRFASLEELQEQIRQDIILAKDH